MLEKWSSSQEDRWARSGFARAIVIYSDKPGLVELCRALSGHGIELLSTGGTAQVLADSGIATVPVSEYTGAPEILDGRVKTLHPKIHGGLLAGDHRRASGRDARRTASRRSISSSSTSIRSRRRSRRPTCHDARGRGREHRHRRPVDAALRGEEPRARRGRGRSADYDAVAYASSASRWRAVRRRPGSGSPARRSPTPRRTSTAIARVPVAVDDTAADARGAELPARRGFPDTLGLAAGAALRAALRREPAPAGGVLRRWQVAAGVGAARPADDRDGRGPRGKQLSYNNILDLDAALGLCLELSEPSGRGREAQQPVRRGKRSRRISRSRTASRAKPIRPRRSAALSRSTARSTKRSRSSWSRRSSSA